MKTLWLVHTWTEDASHVAVFRSKLAVKAAVASELAKAAKEGWYEESEGGIVLADDDGLGFTMGYFEGEDRDRVDVRDHIDVRYTWETHEVKPDGAFVEVQ